MPSNATPAVPSRAKDAGSGTVSSDNTAGDVPETPDAPLEIRLFTVPPEPVLVKPAVVVVAHDEGF